MAESVEHAFIGDNAVGEREFGAGLGETYWPLTFPLSMTMVCYPTL